MIRLQATHDKSWYGICRALMLGITGRSGDTTTPLAHEIWTWIITVNDGTTGAQGKSKKKLESA